MKSLPDCDNFVVGNDFSATAKPFEYNLKKVSEYLKATNKTFSELTESELEKLK